MRSGGGAVAARLLLVLAAAALLWFGWPEFYCGRCVDGCDTITSTGTGLLSPLLLAAAAGRWGALTSRRNLLLAVVAVLAAIALAAGGFLPGTRILGCATG